jgi:putative addiction module component (TIGR02574 family)
MSLSLSQKLEMTEALWDSIYEEAQQLPINAEQAALLDERLSAYVEQPLLGSAWDDVVHRIKRAK